MSIVNRPTIKCKKQQTLLPWFKGRNDRVVYSEAECGTLFEYQSAGTEIKRKIRNGTVKTFGFPCYRQAVTVNETAALTNGAKWLRSSRCLGAISHQQAERCKSIFFRNAHTSPAYPLLHYRNAFFYIQLPAYFNQTCSGIYLKVMKFTKRCFIKLVYDI